MNPKQQIPNFVKNLSASRNKNLARVFLLLFFVVGISSRLMAQAAFLVDIDNGSGKAWIVLETDKIGIELDSQFVEDYASSITNEGIVLVSSNRLYYWSQIKSIKVPNRYGGKKSKRIYWSAVSTGLFLLLATDFYMMEKSTYGYIPLGLIGFVTAPVWGIVVPVFMELVDGPSKRIRLEIEGEVRVEPYRKESRYFVKKGK